MKYKGFFFKTEELLQDEAIQILSHSFLFLEMI